MRALIFAALLSFPVMRLVNMDRRVELPTVPLVSDTTFALEVTAEGRVLAGSNVVYDPFSPGTPEQRSNDLRHHLARWASRMPMEPLRKGPGQPRFPTDPIVIRADGAAPFGSVLETLRHCRAKGVMILNVQLAVLGPDGDEGTLDVRCPLEPEKKEALANISIRPRPGGGVEYTVDGETTGDPEKLIGLLAVRTRSRQNLRGYLAVEVDPEVAYDEVARFVYMNTFGTAGDLGEPGVRRAELDFNLLFR